MSSSHTWARSRAALPRCFIRHGMLPQLAALEAVVRLGSVTQAADELCMAQPTLSGHLRKLSQALGVRLFEPAGRRLVPTAATRVLLASAHEMFDALGRCEAQLAHLREPRPGFSEAVSAAWGPVHADLRHAPREAASVP